jgi:hypothetical protein
MPRRRLAPPSELSEPAPVAEHSTVGSAPHGDDGHETSRQSTTISSNRRKTRSSRSNVFVEGDLPPLAGLMPWERHLLLPIVERLVEDALADDSPREHNPRSDGDQDKEP